MLADQNQLGDDRQAEAELVELLKIFAVTHAETLDQLDRTDRALDNALAYFAAKERE